MNATDRFNTVKPLPMKRDRLDAAKPVGRVRHFFYSGVAKNGSFQEAELYESAPRMADGTELFTAPPAPAGPDALAAFDDAVALELPRVSHVEYDSHEICKHFASKVRERIAAIAKAIGDTK